MIEIHKGRGYVYSIQYHVVWGGHLWNPSYFVATVSENTREQIENYINNQKQR